MSHTRIRTGALIGGSVLALLLAGCDSGGTAGSDTPDVPSIPGSTSQEAPPPTSAAPPVVSTPPSTAQVQQPAPTRAAGGTPECKVADLKLSFGGGEGAAGTTYRNLVFTNKGTRTCTMQGYPGVSYVTGDDGRQVGPAAYRVGEKGPVITLKPGGTAFTPIGFVQVANYDPAVCRPTEVRGLRIYPPHDYDSMFIAKTGTGCTGTPPGNQLTVGTVRAGNGA